MNFKKYYINYVLHGILHSEFYGVRDDVKVRKVLEKIISVPDTAKATYLTGKTAGLEMLFKYLLYISDKIDKAQVTIFNLKDNYEYDLQNLRKICEGIRSYKGAVKEAAVEAETSGESLNIPEETELTGEPAETEVLPETEPGEQESESEDADEKSEFTLIENTENESADDEVFGLEGISRSVELDLPADQEETLSEEVSDSEEELLPEEITVVSEEEEFDKEEIDEMTEYEDEIINATSREDIIKEEPSVPAEEGREDFEFEIKKEAITEETLLEQSGSSGDGSVASEVYYKFENKFFEDVKILEKLFSQIISSCKGKELEKLNDKTLQRFTEIIEISSELADLTRKLEFDLTADIFFTMNILFTRAINTPAVIFPGRIELLGSALALVTSLIKDEDYPGHDEVIKNMELLKEDLKKPPETAKKEAENDEITEEEIIEEFPSQQPEPENEEEPAAEYTGENAVEIQDNIEIERKAAAEQEIEHPEPDEQKENVSEAEGISAGKPEVNETTLFKMKYLVKEFEKIFLNLGNIHGEYSRYEILDAVDEMNELLRMLAKISYSVKNPDVLKLSEVSYVFLKYLKDYKMDLLDKEIQQIIKYIIFTYKMLLTSRKPEDFEKLVQYLNNPVKIFTDS